MKKAGIAAGIFCTAVFFILAVRFCSAARAYGDSAVVLLDGQMLDKKQAAGLCEKELERADGTGCCFWGEYAGVGLMCRETGSTASVSAVVLQGNPELIALGTGMLANQTNGCFIDAQTAQTLFGTRQAAGQTVWCDGRAYTVCGVTDSLSRILIRQISEEDGAVLDKVSLYLAKNGENGSGTAQQFLIRYGLDGRVTDTQFLYAAVQNSLLLLPLLFGVWLIYLIAAQAKAQENLWKRALYLAGALCAAAVVSYCLFCRIRIPADMIPTKWSDFSFWGQWWEKQRENLLTIFRTAKGEAQLTMVWNLGAGLLCNVCAVFSGLLFILVSGRNERKKC